MRPSVAVLLLLALLTAASAVAASYELDDLAFPDDMPAEIGDLAFDSEGTLYACLRRGDVVVAPPSADPKAFRWRVFATALHNPLGMQVVAPGHIVVSQMAELTEIKDTDGDGRADRYNNLSTAWGISGNYHETNSICSDGDGGFYIAVGTASHNGPTFDTPRGDYSADGRRGRNFSASTYKGWVLHYAKDGTVTPHCSGFRMHNGIARRADGTIWCGDNQGDWRGASPIYWCRQDSFSGHPSSLVWDPRFKDFPAPLYWPLMLLDDLYDKPALMLARRTMRSCAEPLFITSTTFGPFKGQMLIPDESSRHILRAMLEKVDGAWQGASTVFYTSPALRPSGNRMALSPDGTTLYYGATARGWQSPNEGIQRLRYTGELPFAVQDLALTETGFAVRFTKPVGTPAALAEHLSVRSYRYEYGYRYGSKQKDIRQHTVSDVSGRGPISFSVSGLEAGRIYELTFRELSAEDGTSLEHPIVEYTLNRLKRPTAAHTATIRKSEQGLQVFIDGEFFTEYYLQGFSNPILWPIHAPGDIRMTRDWPIRPDTPGEEHDHPHHKGLFVGHQKLNGVDFWLEDKPNCGTIKHTRLIETRSGQDRALIKTLNTWTDPKGAPIGADTRTLTFWGDDQARYIDLEINLHATHKDLDFHEMKDSFVGFRSHPHLRVKAKPKAGVHEVFGSVINSEGIRGKKVWGKRADWVHYAGKVEGKDAGYALLSHPDNPTKDGHKSWWHARDYGLISANPFAPKKLGGDGSRTILKGDSLQLRYRFVFHRGSADSAAIAEAFAAYAATPAHPTSLMPPHPGYPGEYNSGIAARNSNQQPVSREQRPAPRKLRPAPNRGGAIRSVRRETRGKPAPAPALSAHGLVEGRKIFVDRDYRYTSVPESLRGADVIHTFNNDKRGGINARYHVELAHPCSLILLVDTRVEAKLSWLKESFERTEEFVTTDTDFRYRVYRQHANPGTVELGPQTDGSFYTIAAIKQTD